MAHYNNINGSTKIILLPNKESQSWPPTLGSALWTLLSVLNLNTTTLLLLHVFYHIRRWLYWPNRFYSEWAKTYCHSGCRVFFPLTLNSQHLWRKCSLWDSFAHDRSTWESHLSYNTSILQYTACGSQIFFSGFGGKRQRWFISHQETKKTYFRERGYHHSVKDLN